MTATFSLLDGPPIVTDPGTWVMVLAPTANGKGTSLPLYLKLRADYKVSLGDKISDRDDFVIGGSVCSTFTFNKVVKIVTEPEQINLLNAIWELSRDKDGKRVKNRKEDLWSRLEELIYAAHEIKSGIN